MKNNILIAFLFISVFSLSSCKKTTFTTDELTYEIISPIEVQLKAANISVTQVNLPTITHKHQTYLLIIECKPYRVTSIGDRAFFGCKSLTSITIPESVTSIGYEAFLGCSSLTSVVVEQGNAEYDSRDNCNAIIETASNTLISGCQNTYP